MNGSCSESLKLSIEMILGHWRTTFKCITLNGVVSVDMLMFYSEYTYIYEQNFIYANIMHANMKTTVGRITLK